jgi:hypothetical protein
MSSVDWVPELAAALDELVPQAESSRADWNDVVARADSRRMLRPGRARPRRRLRLVLVAVLLLLLLTGVATATYLLVHGNGKIAVVGRFGQLLAVNPNGPGLRTIARCTSSRCRIFQPAWSPDGSRVAFVRGPYGSSWDRKDNRMFVYVAGADGRGAKRLASCGTCGEQYGSQLVWSPNGKRIAFTGDAGTKAGYQSLSVVAAGGGRPHRLTDCRGLCADLQPAWSPNGRRLVFARWSWTPRDFGLFTIRLDGSGLKRIASGSGDPEWSPDGHRIVFDRDQDTIAVVNADGSHAHVLFAGARLAPLPGPPTAASSSSSRLRAGRTTSKPRSGR